MAKNGARSDRLNGRSRRRVISGGSYSGGNVDAQCQWGSTTMDAGKRICARLAGSMLAGGLQLTGFSHSMNRIIYIMELKSLIV